MSSGDAGGLVQPTASSQPGAFVYLTFDDGPDRKWTPRVLDVLSQAGVYATFFMIGEQAQREAVLVRRVIADGHSIGNHTYTHRHPWTMSARAARAEVRAGAAALADIVGHAPRFYRAPHGRNRTCMTTEAREQGEITVDWDLSAIDWGPFAITDRIANRLWRVRPGDILLMHDGRNRHNRPDQLLRVFPAFLDELQRRDLMGARLCE